MSAGVTDRHGIGEREASKDLQMGNRESLNLSENAIKVLKARYLKKNESGQVTEGAETLFRRVARTIAAIELEHNASESQRDEWAQRFYQMMASGRFMPNSPTLMNAGREMGMLSACFVLPVRDSINDIFESIRHTALIQKAGGGTGFAFDELRPTGDYIKSSGGTTSGPISFWRAFSEATNAIQQGAFRRGANMGMMYIHHPDILKFLHAKQDLSQFNNYNISVKITDEWMKGFQEAPDSPHVVRNPRNGQEYILPRSLAVWEYDVRTLIPVRRESDGRLRAIVEGSKSEEETNQVIGLPTETAVYTKRDIWDIIVTNAHRTGEPGVVFIDHINAHNPTPHLGRMEATNPCGEQPLLPYEACNLGSINLGSFVSEAGPADERVDWPALRETIHDAIRFLDNVIEANNYPLPEIDRMCKGNRKIGLGVMGFADALFKLGVPYSSEEGIAWGERFMQFVNEEAHQCSEQLARERGCFPNWAGSIWDTRYHRPMRNAACTTVAPTGTISIIAGCSCGIEPMFSLVFYRNVLKGKNEANKPMLEVNNVFEKLARCEGIYSEGLMEKIAKDGTLAGLEEVPESIRRVFVCAHDITPEWHIRMQAAFQRHCDASISKTINFPHGATRTEVDQIYRMAYEFGCKGVTVYRDGCRSEQPMALQKTEQHNTEAPSAASTEKAKASAQTMTMLEPKDIPEIVSGLRLRQMTPFGNMHVKITVDPKTERELEVFAQLGKGGDIANSDLEAICRMISLWLRSGGSLRLVIQQLKDIGSSLQVPTRDGKIMSLGDGLARALQKYMRAKELFGLRDLLLGECDLSELSKPASSRPGNGHRSGNGHGKKGGHVQEVRRGMEASRGTAQAPALVGSAGATFGGLGGRIDFKVKCPNCGQGLAFVEGCSKCYGCGWAQC
ncbi:MAG: vitamin B12-dependent ribonucleotide reductase [Phycisphaerales bacterium]|nr:vitamin B12-dependent ribonucleotide reductase [Phycisphaerales bacterium]